MTATTRLRILVTGPDVHRGSGAGVQRHVRNLMTCFEDDPSISVRAFTATSNEYHEPWALKGVRLLWRYAALVSAATACDVVHVNSSINDRAAARDAGFAFLSKLLGRRVVVQFHGGRLSRLKRTRRGLVGRWVAWNLARADLVLFLSDCQAHEMEVAFGLQRTELVRNFVDTHRIVPGMARPFDRFRVLFLGRLVAEKGVLESIDGFASAKRDGWELRVAGSGPLASQVASAAEACDGATYVGHIDGDDLVDALSWANVLVLPSAHDEGLPYSVLEAAAAACALITSDRGALPLVTLPGITGIIVPPKDASAVGHALLGLAGDRARLDSFGRNARDLAVGQFSFEHMQAEFSRVYRRAAGPRAGAPV